MADFIAKTLEETTRAIQHSVFAEEFASRKGFLQTIDPRIKVVTILWLLFLAAGTKELNVLIGFYFVTLVLAFISYIPPGFFIKRVWFFIPLFTALIALPSIFNIITPGKDLYVLFHLPSSYHFGPYFIPDKITITAQGLRGAEIFVMRVATCVSLAILLVLTTPWIRVLKALNVLHIPEIAILVLAMTYRYIFLFLRVAESMFLARKSRFIAKTNLKEQHRWLSARIGVLIGKSFNLSNEVHLAMLSRGWSGNPILFEEEKIGKRDIIWLLVVIAFTFIIWERSFVLIWMRKFFK